MIGIRTLTFVAAATVAAVAGAEAARADNSMVCGDRDEIVTELQKSWQEQQTAIGMSNNGSMVEVFSSDDGTWTMLMTMPGGPTCMIGAGNHWDQHAVTEVAGEPV